ncbi:hypothetical protein Ddc_11170 [Ditylenchus destructor]|nr:hypothetical protein Ddc_11170 [Ditylenchus destructor]
MASYVVLLIVFSIVSSEVYAANVRLTVTKDGTPHPISVPIIKAKAPLARYESAWVLAGDVRRETNKLFDNKLSDDQITHDYKDDALGAKQPLPGDDVMLAPNVRLYVN